MKKVVLLSVVLIQAALIGCGNKDKNAGMPPQACGANVPSQYCVPMTNSNSVYGNAIQGPQGYGYYTNNFYVPDYQNVETGCELGSQPISTASGTSCLPTATFQQFGQPVYQQDYKWSESKDRHRQDRQQDNRGHNNNTPGPAVECSPANPCQTGFCQPLESAPAVGYCRAS